MKINRITNDIKSLNTEYKEVKDKLDLIDDEIIDLYKKIEDKKNQIQQKKEMEKDLSNKIVAIEYDIKETQFII